MDSFLTHLNHWHWGVLALGLTVIEVVWPRTVFLWLGLAAAAVSGVLFLFPAMGWPMALLLFLALSLTALGLPRLLAPRHHHVHALPPAIICRASAYVGRMFTLTAPIRNGVGSLLIGNTLWTIRGLDMAAGTQVKVVGFEDSILSVEALEQNLPERPE